MTENDRFVLVYVFLFIFISPLGSNGRAAAATATTTLTVRSTRLLEIDTATRAKTGQIRHAAGSFQNFPRPVLLPVLLPVRPLPPRLLVPRLVRLLLRLLPQPNQRTIRAASVREIVPATFFAGCVSTRMNKWRSLITTSSDFIVYLIPKSREGLSSLQFEIDRSVSRLLPTTSSLFAATCTCKADNRYMYW